MGLKLLPWRHFYRYIELDAAVAWMESREHSGVTWLLPHHIIENIRVVADVANGMGQSGPSIQ